MSNRLSLLMPIPVLIIGGDESGRKSRMNSLLSSRTVSPFDIAAFPEEGETSVKIAHVRLAQQFFSSAPHGTGGKALLFFEMQNATPETQHALLKILEEPPAFGTIILTASRKESLIPTILSRITVYRIASKTPPDWNAAYESAAHLLGADDSIRFSAASTSTPAWIETSIQGIHGALLAHIRAGKPVPSPLMEALYRLNRAQWTLSSTNTTPRLLLENLLLSLPALPKLDPAIV